MIPTALEVTQGYEFAATRRGWSQEALDGGAIWAAVMHATDLATEQRDEPAAVFFAFARRPEAFPEGWRTMTAQLTRAQAARNGYSFAPDPERLDAFCTLIVAGEIDFPFVRDWFRRNLVPRL